MGTYLLFNDYIVCMIVGFILKSGGLPFIGIGVFFRINMVCRIAKIKVIILFNGFIWLFDRFVIIAGDTTPIEVICHMPLVCEESNTPYCYTPSKEVSFHII